MSLISEFDNYVDLLIVTLGPDVSGKLSRMNSAEFDLDFEYRLRDVFNRRNQINWQDALLISEKLFLEEDQKIAFLKLVKVAKTQDFELVV